MGRLSRNLLILILMAAAVGTAVEIRYNVIDREVIERRLRLAPSKNAERRPALEKLFQESGCVAGNLTDQRVK